MSFDTELLEDSQQSSGVIRSEYYLKGGFGVENTPPTGGFAGVGQPDVLNSEG
jgi:hypothetical protein